MSRVRLRNGNAGNRLKASPYPYLITDGSIESIEDGFAVTAKMTGENARDLNRAFLSALRKIEKKLRLRAEWTTGNTTERFFDYVPKGTGKV